MKEGEELCYDYKERTEDWMRKARLVAGRVTPGVMQMESEEEEVPQQIPEDLAHLDVLLPLADTELGYRGCV